MKSNLSIFAIKGVLTNNTEILFKMEPYIKFITDKKTEET